MLNSPTILSAPRSAVMTTTPTSTAAESDAIRELTPARMFWEEIREAQAMSPEDRLFAGARLFDLATEVCKAGIRAQHPDANEEEVSRIFQKRLALQERIERAELEEYVRSLRHE